MSLSSFLLFKVLSFAKSDCCYFIVSDDYWPPIHPTSVYWIIRFWGNAGAATKAKMSSWV